MNPQSTPATRTRLVWHTAEIKRTAAALGIDRSTLYRKLRQHGIDTG